ncbi:MAG TPA: hypothetical protein VHB68_18315, partial [Steroidobacteraceae bacterium]|nr:hypothetical protein [Steroidobacteraceae bacterium]
MNRFFRPVLSSLLCLGFVLQATPAGAQSQPFMVQETFTGATAASDWTLYNDAVLTASPSINIDPVGQGWLR